MNRSEMAQQIKPITEEQALQDFIRLKYINIEKANKKSRVGQKTIDFFTFHERLNTKGKRGISFFEYFENKEAYQFDYYTKFFSWLEDHRRDTNKVKLHYEVFRVYFSAITSFSPLTAKLIYSKYKPTSVLDFTAGWGGRMLGAMALNIPHYTGIELNPNLIEPYKRMTDLVRPHSSTNVKVLFRNCLDVDYSTLDYDLVLTSPPYYNTEIYNHTQRRTTQEWNDFYMEIFKVTYTHLKSGGHYILNIPSKAYLIAVEAIGREADEIFCIEKQSRQIENGKHYKEVAYVWRK